MPAQISETKHCDLAQRERSTSLKVSGDQEPAPEALRQSLLRHSQRRFRRELAANYRSFLAATVTRASPLLLDVCAFWGVDLDEMLWRLRPPAGWPYSARGRADRSRPPGVLGSGVVGRRVRAVVVEDQLDVRTWLGDAFACTCRGELRLWLTQQLPDTLMDSFTDRELATVIDHPILRMRPYRVTSTYPVGHGSMIKAEAPPLSFRLPWC